MCTLTCLPINDLVASGWSVAEISFTSATSRENPYTEVDLWVEFTSSGGSTLRRPAFWDGGSVWKVRLAAPVMDGEWTYRTVCSDPADTSLHGREGCVRLENCRTVPELVGRGPLRMQENARQMEHADGTPFLMVADTPWALPFRGTEESVTTYARNRQSRGFNAALLMSVQPDQRATGPRDRTQPGSFGVGFEDLSEGHLNQLNPEYFQLLDKLIGILLEHGIVPVYSPVFQGYGWKGLGTLGGGADLEEYTRYVRYLVARYGAWPAIWLASADSAARDPVVTAAGEAFQQWDAYRQPTGIHYSPFDDRLANWTDDPRHGLHFNRQYQDAPWLDFQWAQTGHNAEHFPEKVAAMWENSPPKAVANGEPTYENIAGMGHASGWWQGHEAWSNLVHGGTMGVVYGAGGLWNWKLSADEPGWENWCNTQASWREAIDFEGSRYVGYISEALHGLPMAGMEPRSDLSGGHPLLAVEGVFYLAYLPTGGSIQIEGIAAGLKWRWFNPMTGKVVLSGVCNGAPAPFSSPGPGPWVLLVFR